MTEAIASYHTREGKELYYRSWKSDKAVSPCLIFIHGIESHSGWFSEIGEKLSGLGVEVYALDRRGSGLNKEGRGDLSDFRLLIQDLDDFLSQEKFKEREYILVGLCWGAKTALHFFLSYPEKVSRIIFITPGFKTRLSVPFLKTIEWLLAMAFAPQRYLSLPIKPEMFTLEKEYLERIRGDKLRLRRITASFFRENLRLARAINRLEPKKRAFAVPAILFLAEKDEILDNSAVVMFLKKYFKNLRVISYPDSRHGLFFEPKKEELVADLVNWVKVSRN